MEKPNRSLLPPPRILSESELRPVIEPTLRDLQFPGPEMVEEWEPFESNRVEELLTSELIQRALDTSQTNEHVKRLLSDKRHIAIGASLLEKRDEPKTTSIIFVFYNYTDNTTIEVSLDQKAKEVTNVVSVHYQPAPLKQEIEQAISLARKDRGLAERITEDLEGTAILVSPADPEDPNYSHRMFDVRFGCPNERLPKYMALVDLSTETVLKVGPTCAGELHLQGGEL